MSNNNTVRLGPTTRRIMHLSEEHLLKHYALVLNKASSLSSAQRKVVEYRIGYGLDKGTITKEKIEQALQDLSLYVAQSITEKINNDSSTKK